MFLIVNLNPAVDVIYTIDDFELNKIHRTSNVYKQAGGKGINVARASKVLGGDYIVTGLLGGNAGNFILQDLEKSGINNSFSKIDQESRTCLVMVDPKNQKHTVINEDGPAFTDSELDTFISEFTKNIEQFKYLVLSGSVPDCITRDVYAEFIKIASDKGVKSIVDASKHILLGAIKVKPFLVKPNIYELAEAYVQHDLLEQVLKGDFKQLIKLCSSILDEGAENILISMGELGAVFFNKEKAFRVFAPKINAINPIASGDAMTAALAIKLDEGSSFEDAVVSAVAAGTSNATIGGLRFTYSKYEEFKKQTKLEYIKKEQSG